MYNAEKERKYDDLIKHTSHISSCAKRKPVYTNYTKDGRLKPVQTQKEEAQDAETV